MSYFEIINYHKSFGDSKILNGINLNIEKGEVISIIGSSGSGKTTLLRCINFLEEPNAGKMILDGNILFDSTITNNINKIREKRLNFGLVFQSFNLFPQYNALENITLAPNLLLKDKIKEYKKYLKTQKKTKLEIYNDLNYFIKNAKNDIIKEAYNLLDKVGLSNKAKSYPCELSGGQCQRVAIARALALKPKVLCFDEPTSALDPELTGEVLKVIKSLKDENSTMIIVTHEIGFAKAISDKIVFMANGGIEFIGSPDEINNNNNELLNHFLSTINNKEGEIYAD